MARILFGIFFLALITGQTGSAQAAEPLVSVSWLQNNLTAVKVLDVRSDPMAFHKGRIPGAIYTHYGRDGWRVVRNGVPGMRPSNEALEQLLGRLGITAADHVVLVASGKTMPEMAMATRIYWTLKTLGHAQVSILNGGYKAYRDAGLDEEKGKTQEATTTAAYMAKPKMGMAADARDVMMAIKMGDAQLIDNRIPAMYLGKKKSGKVSRPGTIPGALNVPSPDLLNADMTFKSIGDIRAVYAAFGANADSPAIVFCNSGHYASLGWFVASELLGNKDAALYDGSLADWDKNSGNPIVAGIATHNG